MASPGLRQCIREATAYLVFVVFISTLGPLQFGFHLAELNPPRDVITCAIKSPAPLQASSDSRLPQCIPMSEAEFASLSSVFVLGGLMGALVAGPFSTRRGRLLTMRITSLFFLLGAALETLASTLPAMSLGRLLSGVGAGASTVIVPLYVSEVATPRERGLFGSMTQVTINIGILLAQTLGYFLSRGSLWRVILGTGAGIGLLHILGLLLVPESPAWLAANGGVQQAVRSLQRIRGDANSIAEEIETWDIDKVIVEEEALLANTDGPSRRGSTNSKDSHKATALTHVGFLGVVRDPLYRPAIIAVIGIMFAQQFCGINSIMMYSVSLLHGAVSFSSSALTILISLVNLVTTIACAPLADKIGRKACLLLSISGMGSMALLLALSLRWEVKIMSAIAVILFVAFFATGLGPVPFMMASELVGQEAVGATQSWCLAANYVATFIVAQFFPIINTWLNDTFGGRGWAYFGFSALATLSFLFVVWWVPETRGKKDANEVWGRTRRVD